MNLTQIILENMWCRNGSSSVNYCKSIGNSNQEKVIDLDNCTIESPNGVVTVNGSLETDHAYILSSIVLGNGLSVSTNQDGDLIFANSDGNFVVPHSKHGTMATNYDFDNLKLADLKSIGIAVCELMKAIPTLNSQVSCMDKIEEIEDALDSQSIELPG